MTGSGGTLPATGAVVRNPRFIEWQPHRGDRHLLHRAADSLEVTWKRGWKRGKMQVASMRSIKHAMFGVCTVWFMQVR